MNLRGMVKKLQIALCNQGKQYKVDHRQTYSPKTNRMITKYIVIHTERVGDRNKNTTVLETYKLYEVVTCLADAYRGESGWS